MIDDHDFLIGLSNSYFKVKGACAGQKFINHDFHSASVFIKGKGPILNFWPTL